MKKILLVYPKIPSTYWGFKYSLRFIGKKANFPPLGLLTVAALLPKDYELKLIDMNNNALKEKDIAQADMVFISAMIVQKESMEKVIQLCRKLNKTVVSGGPYPTSFYQSIEGVDYFVLNEAEITLPLFIADLESGDLKKVYSTDKKPDISKTPAPRFDLVNINNYSSIALQFSRGCPFNCEFCDIIGLFGRIPRTKLPEQFIAELEDVYNRGYRGSIFIVDDNFIGNKAHVKAMLREIIIYQKKMNFPFFFYTEASINLASDEELMDLMVEAGFNMAFIGIETPVEKSLMLTQKSQNTKIELLESVRKIQRKGIEVSAGFILGFDNDPENIADLQIDFIKNSGIPMAMVGLLTAIPNTDLYRRLDSEKRMLHQSSGNNTHDLELNFIPKMPAEKLIEGYKRVISTIYTPKVYFERCMKLINTLPSDYRFSSNIHTVSDVFSSGRAFIVSFIKQTFSLYGLYYLKFLFSVIIKKPALFPKSIQLSILGYHFFKITGEQMARKVREADNFGIYLDNILSAIQMRISKIRILDIKDAVKDILIFRSKILPEIRQKYNRLKNYSSNNIDNMIKNLVEKSKLYLEKVSYTLKEGIEKIDVDGIQKSLIDLNKYRRDVILKIGKNYGNIQGDIQNYSRDKLKNLEDFLDKVILETEVLLYKKALRLDTSLI